MDNEIRKIVDEFEKIFNEYQSLRKRPIQYDENTILYRSEVHMIEVIGSNDNINVTKLSNKLGITKGAVSQFIDKLCKKQMILKCPSPLTNNEVVLTLTERGKKIFKSHEEFHQKMYKDFEEILKQYPHETCDAITAILNYLENYFK